jgi:hypothetical protein
MGGGSKQPAEATAAHALFSIHAKRDGEMTANVFGKIIRCFPANKKAVPGWATAFSGNGPSGLTLGELEALAGTRLTGLFPLFHPRVAGEEAGGAKSGFDFGVFGQQGAGESVADGSDLAGHATTFDIHGHIILLRGIGDLERLNENVLQRDGRKIFFKSAIIDRDRAGTGGEADASGGGFAATGGSSGGHGSQ